MNVGKHFKLVSVLAFTGVSVLSHLDTKNGKISWPFGIAHLKTGGDGGEESLRATQPQMNDEDTSTAIDSNF